MRVGGAVVAETDNALSLAEASYPVVQYIPLADIDQALLERTTTQTYCPYKGDASYYTVKVPDSGAETDVIWTYEHLVPVGGRGDRATTWPSTPDRAEITVEPASTAPGAAVPSRSYPGIGAGKAGIASPR